MPATPGSDLTHRHLEKVRAFYDGIAPEPNWLSRGYRRLLAHYYNLLIPPGASVLEVGCGAGELLGQLRAARKVGVDLSERRVAAARARVPEAEFHVQAGEELALDEKFDVIVVSDTVNYAADVQQIFERLQAVSTPRTRLILNFHSNVWHPVFALAHGLRLRTPEPQSSWLATSDLLNLLQLADWEMLQVQPRLLLPLRLGGVENFFNRLLAPLLPFFCLTVFLVARPRRPAAPKRPPTVSVIIPARNEAGNIQAAVERTPEIGGGTELIFVEGHSQDNTWAEIQRVAAAFPHRRIKLLQQTGKGKGNAVREGFAVATGDILMILDADLTMPPEELPKFYEVIASGRAEFANGVRLVYPMEHHAMQFLNLCANKSFSLLFTWLLGQAVKDTLCGTKVVSRVDYENIAAQRTYFGDFDPFGDFDLLFGAGKLNLKIADVPIRYCERTYGSTNIHRWRHGWLLLGMVIFAARKLKFV
ncbi:MAG: bifunctional class I SAM-dependent methyltransferase/glycosyltransferase family 2 protein [Opitutaceae bacterium]